MRNLVFEKKLKSKRKKKKKKINYQKKILAKLEACVSIRNTKLALRRST
jgi:hypothetical protein